MRENAIRGNRLALMGAVLYLLEWVAIVAAGGIGVFFDPDTAADRVVKTYAGNGNWYGWAAGWFAVVLLGRVAFAVAVRHSITGTDNDRMLAEVGVLAMLAGVVIEASSYAFVMAGAVLADHHGSASSVRTLDGLCHSTNSIMWGPSGLAVALLAWAMWRDGRFPSVLCGLGLLGGALLVASTLLFDAPRFTAVASALQGGATVFWVWMIWTAVLLWRRTPTTATTRVVGSGVS